MMLKQCHRPAKLQYLRLSILLQGFKLASNFNLEMLTQIRPETLKFQTNCFANCAFVAKNV